MAKCTRFVGLDVHAETIAVAVAEGRSQVKALGTIPNRPEAVRRLLGNWASPASCGFVTRRDQQATRCIGS